MGVRGQPLTVTLPVEGIIDLDVLCWGLTGLGFEVDNRVEAPDAQEPAQDSASLREIAQKTAQAAELASTALEKLLELHTNHPAQGMLASAASAAAAAAVKLLGAESEVYAAADEGAAAEHAHDHHHEHDHQHDSEDPCGCNDCQESYKAQEAFDRPDIAAGVRCSTGRLRVMDGHRELVCSWYQAEDSDTITLTPVLKPVDGPMMAVTFVIKATASEAELILKELLEHAAVDDPDEDGEEEEEASDVNEEEEASDVDEKGEVPTESPAAADDSPKAPSTPPPEPAPTSAPPPKPSARPTPVLSWREVRGGAPELQGALDALPEGALAVVSWHADWVPACSATEAALAQRAPPGVQALLRVRIEATPANRALALKRVAALPQARRAGSKLVLRSGASFPALSLLAAPAMQGPLVEGSDALHLLHEALATALDTGLATLVNGSLGHDHASDNAEVAALTKGAKQLLETVRATADGGRPAVICWAPGDWSQTLATTFAPELHGLVRLVTANLETPAVQTLFAGLRLRRAPCVQVFAGGKEVLRQAHEPLLPALLRWACVVALRAQAGESEDAFLPIAALTPPPPAAAAAAPAGDDVKAPKPQAAAPAAPSQDPSAPAEGQASVFDPPDPKLAKPGYTKRLPNGETVHYFPKMPCLRCGCPWWSSDDWDAKCIRCGWDCESTGYDDDSQPLPKYKKKWQDFVAQIQAGRTAPWKKS